MRSLVKALIRRLAEHFDAFDAKDLPATMRLGKVTYVKIPESSTPMVKLPDEPPFRGEGQQAYRQESAMMLLDDDVYGFVLVLLRQGEGETDPRIEYRIQTAEDWKPAFHLAHAQLILAG